MSQRTLKFKLEYNDREEITPYAGLGVYGEMYKALGIEKEIEKIFPHPGSSVGYKANTYIYPLTLLFLCGGKYIEDIRKIKVDKGLKKICDIKVVPSADAIGDWLRRNGAEKSEQIKELNDKLISRVLKKTEKEKFTLDIDATEIIAEKQQAEYTYNGNKGYMPILGFVPELDICAGNEFREGNEVPASRNYEFAKEIIDRIEKTGKHIGYFRSDAAAYEHKLFNYLNSNEIRYAIAADKDESVMREIKRIPEKQWKKLNDRKGKETDREYAEFIHTMNKTDHSFRVLVQRYLNKQRDLFKETEEYYYYCIATNYSEEEKTAEDIIHWYNVRSNSENYNKEVKAGFNLEYMPCGDFDANAVWFGIGMLAYNLFIMSKLYVFPKTWLKKKISTIRWQFIQMAGKIMSHSRGLILRICSTLRETFEIYDQARRRCCELRQLL